ncbi:MAG: hypothetical protein Q4E91_08235 [Lachnospiraceae bacterium]|nr:hypothetical protein [Lachnospiraceae bacterium]
MENPNRSRGRTPKKDSDSNLLMHELIRIVAEVYHNTDEIKATATELSLPPNKVKKLLITGKVLSYPETEQIQALLRQGKTMEEIQAIMDLSYSAINTYLPYSKGSYKLSEVSQNAERVRRYQERKQTVDKMKEACTEENLWKCIIAFQNYPFYTASGLPFTYNLKIGRNGEYTKELFIDRRENSKSLAWSSVRIAFERALEKKDTVFDRPKAVADVRGVSYSYSLLWRFGVIRVPEDVEMKLRGKKR